MIKTGQGKLYEALHENDCDGKMSLRTVDPCASEKLTQIKQAIENQSQRFIQLIAGETISALKFVYVGPDGKAYLGDSTESQKSEIFGMTLSAGNANDILNIATFGPVYDATFAYGYSNSLYLTTMGNISTTSPTTGFRAIVGKALNDGQIYIDIDEVITL